jgi:uncharacterized membrane protein YhaH (DUF805 family)
MMGRDNPFSFKGRIGLGRFWLTLAITTVLQLISTIAFPVEQHRVSLGYFSSIQYATPIEPITSHSWILFGANCAVAILIMWVFAASFAKRLRDREINIKWLLIFPAAVTAAMGLDALLFYLGLPRWVFGAVSLVPLAPIAFMTAVRIFEALFLPSRRSVQI